MPHFSICSSEYSSDINTCRALLPSKDGRGGTLLGADYEPGCFFEQRIA